MSKSQGIQSKQKREVGVRTGAQRREINPRAVAQVGSNLGNHSTNRAGKASGAVEKFVGTKSPISVPLGNEVSAKTVAGPGGSRDVSRSGSQGTR